MTKKFTLKSLAFLALAGLFYGCQQEDLGSDPAPLFSPSQTSAVVAENCDVIDFENAGQFPRDANGYITGVLSQKGEAVGVRGVARISNVPSTQWETDNRANIFNTTALPDDHPDADLETPNWNNTTPSLGNVLIVQELVAPHNVATDPNDNAHGGILELDFSAIGPVTVNAMHVLDIEQHYELNSRVDFYDAANNKINTSDLLIAPTGNNGVAQMSFADMKGVTKMVITFDGAWNPSTNAGSGAIDNIEFCKDTPPPPTCAPCEGKVNSLTFRYNGPDNATLVATAKVGAFFVPILTIHDLDAGETFVLDGARNIDRRGGFAGTLGTEVLLVQAAQGRISSTMIHTSCSQPIYQSYEDGMYTTLAGSSKIGGALCAFAPPVEEEKPSCTKQKCRHEHDKKCKSRCSHKCEHHDKGDDHHAGGPKKGGSWWNWF
ncbi:MAG: hypothetical protein ACO1NZ_13285 [Adhaeribacter sp.]